MKNKELYSKAEAAAEMIGTFLLKWGRVPVRDYKEKYYTVRVYCNLGWYNFHDIFYPGHTYYKFSKRGILFDSKWGHVILKYTGLQFLSFHYHKFLYRLAYKRALKAFPEIRENILCCADWEEYLKGL